MWVVMYYGVAVYCGVCLRYSFTLLIVLVSVPYIGVVCFGYLVVICGVMVYCTFGLVSLCWGLCLCLILLL